MCVYVCMCGVRPPSCAQVLTWDALGGLGSHWRRRRLVVWRGRLLVMTATADTSRPAGANTLIDSRQVPS